MGKTTIRANGALSKCKDCDGQTEVVLPISGCPRDISVTGKIKLPFCKKCLAKSSFGKRPEVQAMLRAETAR